MLFKRGNVWWYEFTFLGQRIRESTYSASRTVAQGAFEARRKVLVDAVNGVTRKKRPLLFKVAAKEWVELKTPKWTPATLRIERKNLDHLVPFFGGLLLIDVEAGDIARYQEERKQQGAAGATINKELGTLRAILRKHGLWAVLQPDVARLEERDDVGVALTPEQERDLLVACRASRSRLLYPAVGLAIYTGLRRGELLSLRWGQVDLDRKVLRVGQSKTDAGKGRLVPLNTRATEVLTAWATEFPNRKPQDAVFPQERVGAGGDAFVPQVSATKPDVSVHSLKEAWESAKRRAKMQVRWHDLRHTTCTRLLEAGVTLPVIARILGWSDSTTVRMAKRYGHISEAVTRKALEELDTIVIPPVAQAAPDLAQVEPASTMVH